MTGLCSVAGVGALIYAARHRREQSRKQPQGSTTPSKPITEPAGSESNQRINRSSHDDNGTVTQTVDELLAQARRYDPAVTRDELTGARLAASEHGSGSFTELAAIVDTELNRAERKGMSLFDSLTHEGTFGRQGRDRPASTRRDPRMRHLLAARAVLSGKARGVSRGATRFFDPAAMERMHRRYRQWVRDGKQGKKPPSVSCDAMGVLEAWSFDLGRDRATGNRCPPDRTRKGKRTMMWVGEIDGVDPLRLMLMAPAPLGKEHTRRYAAAGERLRKGLGASV